MSKPIVAIVGRPNVGKSTFFNQIGKKRVSIVEDFPGVTRDRIYMDAEWLNHQFTMIDTGGIELENDGEGKILASMRQQARLAIEEADVIVFMVDGRTGMTHDDEEIGHILRNTRKPVIVAVNKIDSPKQHLDVYEFYNLGLGEPIGISAANALNVGDLLDEIVANFPKDLEDDIEHDEIRIAVIGRPNVGKSSLTNAILGEDRVIVSNIEGTTRDAIDTAFEKDGYKYRIIDTAGMRKKGKVYENIEKYSVLRALKAVEQSDVILCVVDGERGIIEQDKHVAGYAHELGKSVVLVVNKWDAVTKDEKTMAKMEKTLREQFKYLDYARIAFVSALKKQRINTLFDLIVEAYMNAHKRVTTSVLNDVIVDAQAMNPTTTFEGGRLKIYYANQVAVQPPTFVLFVNDPKFMHFSYKRYLENCLRDRFGFEGTPIHIICRKRD